MSQEEKKATQANNAGEMTFLITQVRELWRQNEGRTQVNSADI